MMILELPVLYAYVSVHYCVHPFIMYLCIVESTGVELAMYRDNLVLA